MNRKRHYTPNEAWRMFWAVWILSVILSIVGILLSTRWTALASLPLLFYSGLWLLRWRRAVRQS